MVIEEDDSSQMAADSLSYADESVEQQICSSVDDIKSGEPLNQKPISISDEDPGDGKRIPNIKRHSSLELVQKRTNEKRWVIRRDNPMFLIWKNIVNVLCIISSFNYSYKAAFLPLLDPEQLESLRLKEIGFNVVFTIDLVLMFFVEHHYQTDEVDIDG